MVTLSLDIVSILLIIETVLLLATIILIILSRKEYLGRLELIDRMKTAIELLTRKEYFDAVLDIYGEARSWIVATVTGSKPREKDKLLIENLLSLMESKVKEAVEIKLVMPKSIEKLYMGYRYNHLGIKVKYHENLMIYDLRYTIADGKTVVMGFPIEAGETKPTRRGVKIYSETLAAILNKNFERYWNSPEAVDYETFLRTYVVGMLKEHSGITLEAISNQLDIPESEIRRVIKNLKTGNM